MALGAIAGASLMANAENTIDIIGSTYTVDTLFHAKVGPGTTQTHLELVGPYRLQVHYLTVDKTTPGVSMRVVCATDKVAGNERTSQMAQRKSGNGVLYFAGTNGDFYSTSGVATNGSSKVGSPTTSCTADREIYKTSNSNYQFVVDTEGVARIGRLNYYTGTATLGEKVTLFKGVNVASPNNGVTIYTSKYWGSTNQNDKAGSCAEVTAKLVEGDNYYAGPKWRREVTSTATSDGDTTIPAGGFVIHGRGTSTDGCNTGAIDFVNALQPGDIVEFDNIILLGDQRIVPTQIVSGNPKTVGAGVTLDTEGERGDASGFHPRTGIGVSQTGDSIIMMVIDGRYSLSAGVRTSMLADVMRYAKAYEALNIDGGGSSTLYTAALGVRNHCSDSGGERSVGNAVFATVEAPEDNEIAEIQFMDWAMVFPKYGIYKPTIYGYNKYGVMVDNNVQGYTLSCPAELGEITNDGSTFFGNGEGYHTLTATYNGLTAAIPVTIESASSAEFKYSEVLLDNYREWPVEVQALFRDEYMPLSAEALVWAASDAAVVTVGAETGVVKGVKDGSAVITGSVGDFSGTVNLTIECPTDRVMPVEKIVDTEAWTTAFTGVGISNQNVTALGESGMAFNFTLASGRSRSITINRSDLKVWSLPDAIRFTVNPGAQKISTAIMYLRANNGVTKSCTLPALPVNTDTTVEIPVSDFADINDIGIYPIYVNGFNFVLSGGTVGSEQSIQFSKMEAVYNNSPVGIEDVVADASDVINITVVEDVITVNESVDSITLYNLEGQKVAETVKSNAVTAPAKGSYIVKVTANGQSKAQKVII